MTTKRKAKLKPHSRAVCAAIRAVRTAANLTQASFAQQLGTSALNVSRWERGIFAPRDREMLQRLRTAAANAGLAAEEGLFLDALLAVPSPPRFDAMAIQIPSVGFGDWELMTAVRIASGFIPEEADAARLALTRAIQLLHEIIRDVAKDGKLDAHFYRELESNLNELVARKVFAEKFKKEGKQ